jgi:hypothetical protein
MLLTDGYIGVIANRYPKMAYYSNDRELLDLFESLYARAYGVRASHKGEREIYYKRRIECRRIYDDLIRIGGNLDKKAYTNINFLRACNRKTRVFGLMIAMSAEGYLSLTRKENGALRPLLGFACANKKACEAWIGLMQQEGMRMAVRRDRNVSTGIHGLETVAHESILAFERLGGFLPGVKVQKGKRFKGVQKCFLLTSCAEFIKRKRENQFHGYTKETEESFYNRIWAGIDRAMQG